MSSIAATLPAEAFPPGAEEVPTSRRGCARLEIAGGTHSQVVSAQAHSPLRILLPKNHGNGAWAYLCSLGGGLLGGDVLDISVNAGPGSMTFLGTQSSTKVFRCPGENPTRQSLHATIGDDAVLMLLPDPVACFTGARYVQTQRFDLHANGSVAILDWLTSGRHARGERWEATQYASSNELWREGTCLVRDRLRLTPGRGALGMDHFNCLATLMLNGPRLAAASAALLADFNRMPVIPRTATPFGASPLGDGLILRVAGPDIESVARFLFPRLEFLAELLGDCPWRRKW